MPLSRELGLGPGHIVFDRDPAPPKKGAQSPNFWPMCLAAKRLDGSRCRLVGRYRPRPWPHCVRWGSTSPPPKDTAPIFVPCLLWSNGCPSQLLLSTCFRIAAAVVMICLNFKILTVSTVKRVYVCHHTNFRTFVAIVETVAAIWLFSDFSKRRTLTGELSSQRLRRSAVSGIWLCQAINKNGSRNFTTPLSGMPYHPPASNCYRQSTYQI